MKKFVALLLCGLAVSSCTTSRENYETGATALAGSKSLRRLTINQCTANAKRATPLARHSVALLMDVNDNEVDRLFCRRVVNAVAEGRISYDEAVSLRYGRPTPNFVKIVQGR